MPISSVLTVIAAISLPASMYLILAFRERTNIRSVEDFLPLRRYLSAEHVSATVVAAGMSMATVMVALLNLAPILGIALFLTIATYALGFGLLALCAQRILTANPRNLALQAYLGDVYDSNAVRWTSSFFALVGYLSIFSMELLVGVSVLSPFFGSWTLSFAVLYLALLLTYTTLGGYRSVVATDHWQLRFILIGIVALFGYACWSLSEKGWGVLLTEATLSRLTTWRASLAFTVGIVAMNIPAPLSDAGSWQRMCSASSPATARKGLLVAVTTFVFIWSALILVGCFYPSIPHVTEVWDSSSEPLITGILRAFGTNRNPIVLSFLFLFVLGLFSAMISTADSLLIAASQIGLTGFRHHNWLLARAERSLHITRALVVLFAVGAFGIFVIFQLVGLNVVQLVFAIYGAQLAMFPATAAAIFCSSKCDLRRLRHFALVSIIVGFVIAWSSALYGHVSASLDLQFYAPAFALCASVIVIIPGVFLSWKDVVCK